MKLIRNLFASFALLVTLPAAAQIVGPVLLAPTNVSPATGLHVYDFNAPATAFVWNQTPFFAAFGYTLPNHFIVCFRRVPETPCSHANASFNLLPGAVPSTVLRAGFRMSPIGTQYRFVPVLAADRLDTPVRFQVAGCTGPLDSSCQFSTGTWTTLSTMDLKAMNLSPNVLGETLSVTALGLNSGSRESRPSQAKIETWEVIYDSGTADCLKNPNDPRVRNETTLFVIDRKGVLTRFSALPRDGAGNYVASNVIGIYRASTSYPKTRQLPGVVLPPTAGQASPASSPVGVLDLLVPATTRPRAFAHKLTLDSFGQFAELDETDNARAECEAVF